VGGGKRVRTYLEYRDQFTVSGDKVYVDRVEVEAPLYLFPFYELMEPPQETWLVFGPAIRAFLYEDWGLGGHYWIYPFIKAGEIWLDSTLETNDRKAVYSRFAISRFLMKQFGLNYLEADVIGRAYSTDIRVEDIRTGKVALHSFFPKKANLVLSYQPPTPEKRAKDQEVKNWELEEVNGVIASLQARKQLDQAKWAPIYEKLNLVAQDLTKGGNI